MSISAMFSLSIQQLHKASITVNKYCIQSSDINYVTMVIFTLISTINV